MMAVGSRRQLIGGKHMACVKFSISSWLRVIRETSAVASSGMRPISAVLTLFLMDICSKRWVRPCIETPIHWWRSRWGCLCGSPILLNPVLHILQCAVRTKRKAQSCHTIIVMHSGKRWHPTTVYYIHFVKMSRILCINVKLLLQHCGVDSWSLTLPKNPLLRQVRYKTSACIIGLISSQRGD